MANEAEEAAQRGRKEGRRKEEGRKGELITSHLMSGAAGCKNDDRSGKARMASRKEEGRNKEAGLLMLARSLARSLITSNMETLLPRRRRGALRLSPFSY